MLKIYAHMLSPYSLRTIYFAKEINLPHEVVAVKLEKGEHRRPEYLALFPSGKVPAIDWDGFRLIESDAILRYMAQKTNAYDWYPLNLEDRATVDQWWDLVAFNLCPQLMDFAWNTGYSVHFGFASDQQRVFAAEKSLKRFLPVVDERLRGRNYLAGHMPTMADIALMPFAALNAMSSMIDSYPNLRRWLKLMSSRPAWLKIKEESKLFYG